MKSIRLPRLYSFLIAFLLLSSCAKDSLPHRRPRAEASAWTLDRLYFGRSLPDSGQVSEQNWRQFLAEVVTPRFPDGLTVWRAEGQWRDSSGTIVRESTFLLELAHPDENESRRKLREIIGAYKQRFRQESVLRIMDQVRVEF
ncbi:MAG: DUF3574 domain-containing protein [Ferruginibacter sp.]|nr:DUF3574 domain-containing protein [Cytophagales bacterium]